MSDLERPWVERRRSGPPSSCPVCGAATMYVGIAGVLTCRSAAGDHFEWRPDEPAAVRVESERAGEWKCSWCRGHNPATETRCRFCDIEPVAGVTSERVDAEIFKHIEATNHELRLTLEASADDFVETDLTELYEALRPTGPLDAIIRDVKRRMDEAGHRPPPDDEPPGCGCPGAALDAHLAGCPTLPLEGKIVGVDWRAAAIARLRPDVARLAVLHEPTFQRPPKCKGCTSLRSSAPTVKWPCATAVVALGMMKLEASDIAITDR